MPPNNVCIAACLVKSSESSIIISFFKMSHATISQCSCYENVQSVQRKKKSSVQCYLTIGLILMKKR